MALISSEATRRVEIPHEPGAWMDLRRLNWLQLEKAQKAKQAQIFENAKEMGPEIFASIRDVRASSDAESAVVSDPLNTYDQRTVLELGIVGWSYDAPVDGQTVALLDSVTARWAAVEIIGTPTEDGRKNSSGGSGDA